MFSQGGIGLHELFHQCVSWEATEKLDGSMGVLFHFRGEWSLITKRTWNSPQARWGLAWLQEKSVNLEALTIGTTYVCEARCRCPPRRMARALLPYSPCQAALLVRADRVRRQSGRGRV